MNLKDGNAKHAALFLCSLIYFPLQAHLTPMISFMDAQIAKVLLAKIYMKFATNMAAMNMPDADGQQAMMAINMRDIVGHVDITC